METAALVSSILSIILSIIIGGFAIWLSVTFYRMSNKISEDTKEAAKGISASVNRLEGLFDKLYSGTFSIMKDTVTDMRKHIWPVKEKSAEEQQRIEEKANAKINELKQNIRDELSDLIAEKIGRADSKIIEVEQNIEKLVERAIQGTREVDSEAQEAKSMSHLVNLILNFVPHNTGIFVKDIIVKFGSKYPKNMIIDALKMLTDKGPLYAEGDIEEPDTIITVF